MKVAAVFALALSLPLAVGQTAPKLKSIETNVMDRSANPCTDFYQFACGGWMAKNPIPSDQSIWRRINEVIERNRGILHNILETSSKNDPSRDAVAREIGDYFAACMAETAINERGIGPAKPELDLIAALPNKAAITGELARLHRQKIRPFFVFDSEQDFKDATQVIAGLDQAGLGLPDRDYYLKTDAKSIELREKYLRHVEKMFALAGESAETAKKKARVVMDIETSLAKSALDLVSRRDPAKVYHKYTVAELISLSPGIDWVGYFKAIGTPALQSLNVHEPPFVRQIEAMIVMNSLDDLKTYLSWHVLHAMAGILSKPFVDENFQFYGKSLEGAQELMARWKRCVDRTDDQLGDALGQKYVEQTFGQDGKERALKMVRAIHNAMERDIQGIDWMTPETKKQALIKLHAVADKIGYPDKWKDFSSVQIARDDAYGNVTRLREYEVGHELAKIGKAVDRKQWFMSPPTVNAYYNPQLNDINFPAGILQPPFFSSQFEEPVMYGAIGAVIGHELTHGFDDQGRQFDAEGNLRDWWTEADGKAFEKRADCIAEQYSDYVVLDAIKLNGRLTLGENVADNGGVRIALMALASTLGGKSDKVEGFTPEQRFFIGYGQIWCGNASPEAARMRAAIDPHSSGKYRVNGVLSNMPEFQKAFACKVGQPMVRPKPCRVW